MDVRTFPEQMTGYDGTAHARGVKTRPPAMVSHDALYKACTWR
jgi:hypothetical protein